MIWGAFFVGGKADLVVMEGKQNCSIYQCVGKKSSHLLIVKTPIMTFFNRTTQSYTLLSSRKTGLKQKNIEVLDWPTKSPNLNPIKICGEFCQEEYTKINVNLKIEKL